MASRREEKVETSGPLVVTRTPDVTVPVCVVKCMSGASVLKRVGGVSDMACVELVCGPTQTVDGFILEIAPAPWNLASKVRSSFSAWPGRTRLKKPARERPAF